MERIEFKKEKIPFTQVANDVLNDSNLSFKAKGLYAYIYSKPDGWDFSIDRIALDAKDARKAVNTGLQELETYGYLSRERQPDGRVIYRVFFPPLTQMPKRDIGTSDPNVHFGKVPKRQSAKMDTVSNKDIKVIKNISNKETYGEFQQVKLKEEEHRKLVERFGEKRINEMIFELDTYIASKGRRYKSHYATILTWIKRKNTNIGPS